MFNKQTIRDADIKGKRVLVRVDYNVPLDENGQVVDDYRIQASLPTLEYLIKQQCKITLISHLGRPQPGKFESKFTLYTAAEKLRALLDTPVQFGGDLTGDIAQQMAQDLKEGEILLLDNLRFHEGEEKNDNKFAKQLAQYGEVFVQDAFGVSHRKHASLDSITKLLPSYSGLLLELEVKKITSAVQNPERPLLAIIGGAKIETKLDLLNKFIDVADEIVVGGAMANTFIHHPLFGGHEVGLSLVDSDQDEAIKKVSARLHEHNKKLILPYRDVAVGHSVDDQERREIDHKAVQANDMILDYGQSSLKWVFEAIDKAKTIIWNGPMGYFENPAFAHSSTEVAHAIANSDAYSVVGGGDTDDLLAKLNLKDKFNHVSTGGGAALELMAGNSLPGVEALLDK